MKTEDGQINSWLVSAGLQTIPGVNDRDYQPKEKYPTKHARLSSAQKVRIKEMIKCHAESGMTARQSHEKLLEDGEITCPATGNEASFGSIHTIHSKARKDLGITQRQEQLRKQLKKKFIELYESYGKAKSRKKRIMSELSISQSSYEFLQEQYKKSKRTEP